MEIKNKLLTSDSIKVINSKLKSKYKATLFDFAYLLALSLNEGFLPQAYSGFKKRKLNGVKAILTNIKKKLSKYDFLQDLMTEVEKGLHYIDRQQGKGLTEKKKLLHLWSQLLIKEHRKPVKHPYRGKDITIIERTVTNIDWNDCETLLRWFYMKLSDFSYSSLIKLKNDRQEEKRSAKSLLEKNYSDYERRASETLMKLKQAQHYFLNEGPIPQKEDPQRIDVYPLARVGFYKDRIEITELRKQGNILISRVIFLDSQKKRFEQEENNEDVRYPTLVFQNEDPFIIKNYSPPSYPSSDREYHFFEDSIAGSQYTKKP
jgi:hypothetical protein